MYPLLRVVMVACAYSDISNHPCDENFAAQGSKCSRGLVLLYCDQKWRV